MKCKHCNGTGKIRGYFYEKTGINKWEKVWGDSPCEECNGTGEIEQTNEEWLRTATTEQLAELLCDVWYGIDDVINIMEREDVGKKEAMLIWLKEKHNDG